VPRTRVTWAPSTLLAPAMSTAWASVWTRQKLLKCTGAALTLENESGNLQPPILLQAWNWREQGQDQRRFELNKRTAAKDNTNAIRILNSCYLRGTGVGTDETRAVKQYARDAWHVAAF
jgi:hypothetical protein